MKTGTNWTYQGKVVEELPDSERGETGFGSSGR